EEGAIDRRGLATRAVCSLAAVPLLVGGAVVGALGFSRLRGVRAWSDEVMARLQLLADVFANVQARRRADGAVRQSEERRRRAEEEAQRQRDALAHALRVSTLVELAASLRTELTHPVGPIMRHPLA